MLININKVLSNFNSFFCMFKLFFKAAHFFFFSFYPQPTKQMHFKPSFYNVDLFGEKEKYYVK